MNIRIMIALCSVFLFISGKCFSEVREISLCDLPKNNSNYIGKIFKIKAHYHTSYHYQYLYDERCQNKRFDLVRNDETKGEALQKYRDLHKKDKYENKYYYIEFVGKYIGKDRAPVGYVDYFGDFLVVDLNIYTEEARD